MNPFIQVALVFVLLLTPVFGHAQETQIGIAVILGKASDDCDGFGICLMYVDEDEYLSSQCDARGTLSISGHEAVLTLQMKTISSKNMQKHFGNPTFLIAESFESSKELNEELGLDGFIINAGEYEFEEDGGKLKIFLRLRLL